MTTLVPCEACSRHVRAEAERCPFCDVPIAKREPRAAPRGRARVAMYAALLTCASAAGACAESAPPSVTPESGGTAPSGSSTSSPPPGGTTSSSAPKKKEGELCESDDACASGMKCCSNSVCGGRAAQMGNCPPPTTACHVGSTCPVLPMPPYGCVFPDACGATFA